MKWIEIGAEDVVVMTAAPQLYSKWRGVTVPSLPARHNVSSRHRRAPFPIPIRSFISIPTVSCSEAGSARLSISSVFVGTGHLHSTTARGREASCIAQSCLTSTLRSELNRKPTKRF